jgi:predicted Zn finger-like uncharacterized protein
MSLATRCTSCKTVFRVVQDQLKVSEGWVRCGRCGTVFNALEALFDLERDTPARWQSSKPGALGSSKKTRDDGRNNNRAKREPKSSEPTFFARRRSDTTGGEPEAKPNHGHPDFADAQFDADVVAHVPDAEITEPLPLPPSPPSPIPPPPAPAPAVTTPPAVATSAEADTVLIADTVIAGTEAPRHDVGADHEPATLAFVRAVERKAKWRDPRTLAIMGGASAVLSLALLLQVMNHYRDITAARWPSMAPMLVRWCHMLHCQLQAPRRIEQVVVDSITLTRNANSTNTFLLSVALRNQGAFAVAMPTLDVHLRDANRQIITRRMLTPETLQTRATAIEPDTEIQLQVQLTEGEQRIVEYTVEAFYP